MKNSLIVLGLAATLFPLPALSAMWKTMSSTTGKVSYYIDQQTPNSLVNTTIMRATNKTVTLKPCGVGTFKVSPSATKVRIFYNSSSPGSAIDGNVTEMNVTESDIEVACFTADEMPINTAIKYGNNIFIKGNGAGNYQIKLITEIPKQLKANKCGIIRINTPSPSSQYSLFGFNVNGVSSDNLDSIESNEILCRTDRSTGNGIKMIQGIINGSGAFKLDNGKALVFGNPNTTIAISYPATPTTTNPTPPDKVSNVLLNACGFKVVSATTVAKWGNNPKMNGQPFPTNWNNAEPASQTPYCRTRDSKLFVAPGTLATRLNN